MRKRKMKAKTCNLCLMLQMLILIFLLTSCEYNECEHNWKEATCQSPKICTICGLEDGTVSEHNWKDATCIAPKTCTVCGITEGSLSSEHYYSDDVCMLCGRINRINLTLLNYKDYFDFKLTNEPGNAINGIYRTIYCNFEATGNVHYRYDDVRIGVRFIYYTASTGIYSEKTCVFNSNIAGNSSGRCELSTPKNRNFNSLSINTYYEIVSISGTVIKY